MEKEYVEMLVVLGAAAIPEIVKKAFEYLGNKTKEKSEENE